MKFVELEVKSIFNTEELFELDHIRGLLDIPDQKSVVIELIISIGEVGNEAADDWETVIQTRRHAHQDIPKYSFLNGRILRYETFSGKRVLDDILHRVRACSGASQQDAQKCLMKHFYWEYEGLES
jgi:hypothetical protein